VIGGERANIYSGGKVDKGVNLYLNIKRKYFPYNLVTCYVFSLTIFSAKKKWIRKMEEMH